MATRFLRLYLTSCLLLLPLIASLVRAQGTGMEEQAKILALMRQYGDQYVSKLPNFICVQVTRQFEAGKKTDHWKTADVLTYRLSFVKGRDQRKLEMVNSKPIKPGLKGWHAPLRTEGEFGILLDLVLGQNSEAVFHWHGLDTVRGKQVAVFDYSVDQAHSTMKLSLSDLAKAIVPYRGSLYADPATGTVLRITEVADEIPPELDTRELLTTIEYDQVPINGVPYILPVQASVMAATKTNHIRNELEFREYRKFEAESTLTFGSGDTPQ